MQIQEIRQSFFQIFQATNEIDRKKADNFLQQCEINTEFYKILMQIFETDNEKFIKLQSLIQLKNIIKRHWGQTKRHLIYFSDQDKINIKRQLIFYILNIQDRFYRQHVEKCVEIVVQYDFPQNYDELHQYFAQNLQNIENFLTTGSIQDILSESIFQNISSMKKFMKIQSQKRFFVPKKLYFQTISLYLEHFKKVSVFINDNLHSIPVAMQDKQNKPLIIKLLVFSNVIDCNILYLLQSSYNEAHLEYQYFNICIHQVYINKNTDQLIYQLNDSQLFVIYDRQKHDFEIREKISKNLKNIIYKLSQVQSFIPLAFTQILDEYFQFIENLLKEDNSQLVVKACLLGFQTIVKTFCYYTEPIKYQQSQAQQKNNEYYYNSQLQCHQKFINYFSNSKIEYIINDFILRFLTRQDNKQSKLEEGLLELEQEDLSINEYSINQLDNSVYNIVLNSIQIIFKRFPTVSLQLLKMLVNQLITQQDLRNISIQIQDAIFGIIGLAPLVFDQEKNQLSQYLEISKVFQFLKNNINIDKIYARRIVVLTKRWLDAIDEQSLYQTVQIIVDILLKQISIQIQIQLVQSNQNQNIFLQLFTRNSNQIHSLLIIFKLIRIIKLCILFLRQIMLVKIIKYFKNSQNRVNHQSSYIENFSNVSSFKFYDNQVSSNFSNSSMILSYFIFFLYFYIQIIAWTCIKLFSTLQFYQKIIRKIIYNQYENYLKKYFTTQQSIFEINSKIYLYNYNQFNSNQDPLVQYECCLCIREILLKRTFQNYFNFVELFNRISKQIIQLLENFFSPNTLWPLISLFTLLIQKSQYECGEQLIQSLQNSHVMRVLKIDSDLIKIAAIEMLKSVIVSFNDISILNPMYLMTIEFIETALKQSLHGGILSLWYFLLKDYKHQGIDNCLYQGLDNLLINLFQEYFFQLKNDFNDQNTAMFIYIMEEYILLDLIKPLDKLDLFLQIIEQKYLMANKMGESDTQIEIKISCLSLIVTMMLMIMNQNQNQQFGLFQPILVLLIQDLHTPIIDKKIKSMSNFRANLVTVINRFIIQDSNYVLNIISQMNISNQIFLKHYYYNMEYITSKNVAKINSIAILYLLPGMPLDIGKQFIEKLFLSSVPILIKSSNNNTFERSREWRLQEHSVSERKQNIRKTQLFEQIDMIQLYKSQIKLFLNNYQIDQFNLDQVFLDETVKQNLISLY